MHRWVIVFTGCLFATAVLADAKRYKEEDCEKLTAQQVQNHCVEDNYEAADKALNALYRRITAAQTDAKAQERLRDSERVWIRKRDKSCNDQLGPQSQGGSIWPTLMFGCLHRRTDARIRVLERMTQNAH